MVLRIALSGVPSAGAAVPRGERSRATRDHEGRSREPSDYRASFDLHFFTAVSSR